MTKVLSKLEDFAFLAENDSNFSQSVPAQEILAAVDSKYAETNKFMPQGTTAADAWISRHGNPLFSEGSALTLIDEMIKDNVIQMERTSDTAWVVLGTQHCQVEMRAITLPVALVGALCLYLFQMEQEV